MIHQVANPHATGTRSNWLYKVSATASLILGWLLVAAAIQLVVTVLYPATTGWLTLLQHNWLVVIFNLHAGFSNVQSSPFYQMNLLDLAILALAATMYIGLYMALRKTGKVLPLIALAQPILGMVLFVVTKTAGRSSFMGAELVISLVMLRSKLFDKWIAFAGLLSAILLLAGDLGASLAPSDILAIVMGTGYTLSVVWLFLVGTRLLQLARDNELE